MVEEPAAAGRTVESATGRLRDRAAPARPCGAAEAVRLIWEVVADTPSAADALDALTLLRHVQAELAAWEPALITAAREHGASWGQLAPVLGVASRQAAERRYLRVRPPGAGEPAGTGDERIQAERDRRASDRAVSDWARRNAAVLRQIGGQVGAVSGLPAAAQRQISLVVQALGSDDVADLLLPLAGSSTHLQPRYPDLAGRVDAIAQQAEQLRRDAHARRRESRP